jgi:hypothetical protein
MYKRHTHVHAAIIERRCAQAINHRIGFSTQLGVVSVGARLCSNQGGPSAQREKNESAELSHEAIWYLNVGEN